MNAVLLGVKRGWIEQVQSLTTRADQVWIVLLNGIFIAVLWFQRDATIPGTDISLALATLPSLIGMNVLIGGYMGTAQQLAAAAPATPAATSAANRPIRQGEPHPFYDYSALPKRPRLTWPNGARLAHSTASASVLTSSSM